MGKPKRKQKGGPQTNEELIRHAKQRLAAGDAKQALAALRRVQFKGVPSEHLEPLFHSAYLLRARELDERGLRDEAEAARKNAAKHGPSGSDREPTADDILPFLLTKPADSRLAAYARYLRSNPLSPGAEVMLADHLVLNRCWEQLDAFPEACQFRDDARLMASASETLDRGDWDAGSRILEPLPAESAFRYWRTFSVAMAAYFRRDMPAVARALKGLPSDFPLPSAAKALRANSKPGAGEGATAKSGVERLLGVGSLSISKRGQAVRRAVGGAKTAQIGPAIRDFAKAVDPHSPSVTTVRLIRALYPAVAAGQLDEDDYWQAFSGAVPERHREGVEILTYCQALFKHPGALEYLTDIADLFHAIKNAFPDDSDRRVARARILAKLAELVKSSGAWSLMYSDAEDICQILGDFDFKSVEKYARSGRSAAIDLMRLSLAEDPTNAAAHKQLVAMLENGYLTKNAELVSAYEHYAEAVPEDPDPWIALAELRLGSNAYRKAAAALEKARSYASHDHRVSNLMVAASLLATKRNLKQERLALALRDLSNAEALMNPTSEPIVLAWKAVASAAQASEPSLLPACKRLLDSAPPSVRAKAACIVWNANATMDLPVRLPPKDSQKLWNMFREAIRATCETAPAELAGIVEPMPIAFDSVARTKIVSQNLFDLWDGVLRAVPDRDALRIFPAAVECGNLKELRSELARRLTRTQNKTYQRILLLYSATVKYLLGEEVGSTRFRKLIDSIPSDDLKPVRAAAEQLSAPVAMRFVPVLALALKQLQFDMLDEQWGLF